MKKGLLIFSGVIVFLLAALAIIPFFFKDEINAKIKSEIDKNVDAKVDYKDYSLSFFSHFPKLTISIDNLSMVGTKAGFKGDTLFSANNFSASVDVMSVISGDQIKINGIYLDKPYILTKFLKDGRMSWDIAKPSTDTTTAKAPEEKPSKFSLAIEKWKITDATIIYDDASLPMYTELRHLNHEGKGGMEGDVFKILESKTTSPEFFFSFDNTTYLNKHSLEADVKFDMDLKNSVYTFTDNVYKLNNFKMKFGGKIAMPAEGIDFDLKFAADETEFKNLISLIPAIYTKDYENIKADGKIGFDGWYKGMMTDTKMPGFGVNLTVDKAMVQYPNLAPVNNIAIDLKTNCSDGDMKNLVVDLKKFHMDMGQNHVDAASLIKGVGPMDVDATVKANVNLADVSKMYPVDGTDLKGLFNLNLVAKGRYDDAAKQMPNVDAKMALTNGYVKSKDVPFPLENMTLKAEAKSDGTMENSNFNLEGFKMILNGEPFEMKAFIENFDNIKYDVSMKGIVDLEKLTKIYPLDGMTLAGRVTADIETKGLMSDVEAGKYDKTTTSGTMDVANFKYITADMPAVTLSSASFGLTPEKMSINNLDGTVGRSDISVKGAFSNYMGYMFGNSGDTVIHGNMTLASKKFDVNEWMPADEAPATTGPAAPEEPMTVFEVPKDIDFNFYSNMNKVLYDSMVMENMIGNISMKNGILRMDRLACNTLGGSMMTSGSYNTQDLKDPKFEFAMTMNGMQFQQASKSLSMMKTYASMAKDMDGKFNLDLSNIKGSLGQDMMPVYKTVNGSGKMMVQDAVVKGNKSLATIGKLTGAKNMDPMNIKDVTVKFKIVDGNLIVDPFDVNAGNVKMNVNGKQSLEGNLDYLVKMDVPAGAVGTAVNQTVSNLTGANNSSKNLKFDVKVVGPYNDPKVKLASAGGSDVKTAVTDAVEDKAKAEADRLKKEAEDKANAEAARLKAEADAKLKAEQDRLKQEADAKLKAEQDRLKKEAEDNAKKKLKGILNK